MNLLAVPMLFQASREFAASFGDPVIDNFLSQLPEGDCVIDTRSHLLQIGMYPCIPGWHLDAIKRVNGQIDISAEENKSLEHYIMFHGPAPTEILNNELTWSPQSWEEADRHINMGREEGWYTSRFAVEGQLTKLDWNTYHRGTPAAVAGPRCFLRATFGSLVSVKNEVRQQVQVYVPLNYGW